MGILHIVTDTAGQGGAHPRRVKIITTDNLATVTTAGYLDNEVVNGYIMLNTDVVDMIYSYSQTSHVGTYGCFTVNVVAGVVTLTAWANQGNVLLPVVSGDFATFNGTTGQIKDAGYLPSNAAKTNVVMANGATVANHIMVSTDTAGTSGNLAGTAINDGNIQAGRSTVAGSLVSFPSTTTSGSLSLTAVANSGNFGVTISNASHGQATTYSIPDVGAATGQLLNKTASLVSGNVIAASGTGGVTVDGAVAANKILTSSITNPDTSIDLIAFDVSVSQASLALGGSVILQVSSGSKQYKVRSLQLNSGGTNFSGGGGDRLGQITDGTTAYTVIPAATMQSLANAQWGATALPNPNGSPINISTQAGSSLVFKYTGGTTDYTAGNLTISGILQRVA